MSREMKFNFVANCAVGMEDLVFNEIMAFGGQQVTKSPTLISWKGNVETAYRTCLWSRYSSKVLMLIKLANLESEDDLYTETKKINWCEHFNSSMTFAVFSTLGQTPIISHSQYAALRVKDGIVDFFRGIGQQRPNVAKTRPDCRVHLHLHKNQASFYIDFSGDSLHKRGYRETTGVAPLKETLAAAIVTLSGWSKQVSATSSFLDPMCGSGTLLIEAALQWGNTAPGLSRKYYGFSKWLGHDEKCWSALVDEAVGFEESRLEEKWPRFLGYDSDPTVVAVAQKNIERAGLEDKIVVRCREIGYLHPPSSNGYLVSNLPYGDRLSEKNQVGHLYSCVGRILSHSFSGWQAGLFIAEPDLTDRLGLEKSTSHKLYNGAISCRLITGQVTKKSNQLFTWSTKKNVELKEGIDFVNRLRKNYKKIGSWTKKNNINCFRLYDRDLPEYNVAIDIYNKWILVQEYQPPATVDSELAKKRLSLVLSGVREFFQVGRDRVFLKQRKRQRGNSQYQKRDIKPKYYEVREGKCFFLVNFINYVDTGLFLDHRPIRDKIARQAQGKRFLNLFGYTGTASIHAAMGGASHTTTVDLSSTYLEWAAKNLALNGLSQQRHKLVNQDCLNWLKEKRGVYDLIFIDPPTFSNTKKKNLIFDIQKDHIRLLKDASKLLEKDGRILFSTNYRGFTLDSKVEDFIKLRNISKETVPFDFHRNKEIHKCWEMQLY